MYQSRVALRRKRREKARDVSTNSNTLFTGMKLSRKT